MCDVGTDLGMVGGGALGFAVGGPAGAAIGASLGGSVGSMFSGSDPYQMQSPGSIDIAHYNPAMNSEIDHAKSQRSDFESWASQYTNPDRYQQMTDLYSQRAQTTAMNRAAQMGMGGSSVGAGMANEAAFNTQQAMINRQMQDHMQISQMDAVLNGQISGDIVGVQNQFMNFQNSQMQAYNSAQAQNTATRNQMLGTLGTVGGMMAAGPIGGMAGGMMAGQAAAASAPSFGGYQSPNFGYMGGVPSDMSTPSFGQSSPYYGGGSPSSYGGMGVNYGSLY